MRRLDIYKFYEEDLRRSITQNYHSGRAIIGDKVKIVDRRAVSEYVDYKTRILARALYPLGIKTAVIKFFEGGDQR